MLMLSYLMTDVLHLQIFAVQIKQKNIRFLLNLSLSIVVMLLRKKKKIKVHAEWDYRRSDND